MNYAKPRLPLNYHTFDKVLYEEMMTNDNNLESNLPTSSLLRMRSPLQVLLQVESEICYCVDPDPE